MRRTYVICMTVMAAVMLAGVLPAADPAEKELGKEIVRALISKNNEQLLELIPRLNEEGISSRFRLDYCQKLLVTPAGKDLSYAAADAVIAVLADACAAAEPRDQKAILGLMGSAMDKVGRDKDRFVCLLAFYKTIPDPGLLKSVKKLIGRFQDDTAVLCAVFDTLEGIRERDSISLINDYLYKAWKKSQDDLTDQKTSLFLGRISGSAIRALQSLTGEMIADPGEFNKWWINHRGKFIVPPKPEPEVKADAAEEDAAAEEGTEETGDDVQDGTEDTEPSDEDGDVTGGDELPADDAENGTEPPLE